MTFKRLPSELDGIKKAVWGDELELCSVKLVLIDELEPNTVQFSSTV